MGPDSGGAGGEEHRDAVHAIAQAGRSRTVVEDVAEMAAALRAMNRRPADAQRAVVRGADGVLQRLPETRPAGMAVELGRGREQSELGAGAGEAAGAKP